jgi:Zn-dependent peptidase ImmA (M78 family)
MISKALPRKIDLGFWIIDVKYVGERRIREEAECEDDDETPDGAWQTEHDTIYVLRTLSAARKRYTICHELVHAMIDIQDGIAREGKDFPK